MEEPQRLLEMEDVCYRYGGSGTPSVVLDGVNLTVRSGECVVILGPNGCGKTTLCHLAFGLYMPSRGSIRYQGADVSTPILDAAFVFQGDSLFPWLTSIGQIVFALKCRGIGVEEARRQATDALAHVGIGHAMSLYPHQLSGGMRQRVALARAYALEPRFLVLDEPYTALDFPSRQYLQDEIVALRQKGGLTVLAVTHDPDEAAYLATRVVFLSARPGAVVTEMVSPLPQRRSADIRETTEFFEFRTRLWCTLRQLCV